MCVCVFFLSLFLLPETSGTLKPCFLPSRPLGGGGSKKRNSNFFPTCQVRVVRFYVSCLLVLLLLLLLLLSPPPPPPLLLLLLVLLVVLVVLAQLRPAIHSVLCRTSTTTIHAQCSLPDLNHDHPRPVFPAGPQPRPSTPSVP